MALLNMGEALPVNARLYPDKPGASERSRSKTLRQWEECAATCQRPRGARPRDGRPRRPSLPTIHGVDPDLRGHRQCRARDGAHQLSALGTEIRYIVEDSDAKALIVQHDLVGAMEGIRSDLSIAES